MDASGEHQLGVDHNIVKVRLSLDGKPIQSEKGQLNAPKPNPKAARAPDYCGDCFGGDPPAGSQCCNTCEDVQEAYRKKGWAFHPDNVEQCVTEGFSQKLKEQQNEGCRLNGYLLVNKVVGNFHIAPGKSFQADHAHVHDVDLLRLGGSNFDLSHTIHSLSFGQPFPGIKNPLDDVNKPWTGS
jgi:endoplasmic reticulum-Golgi intermediate compartment protein 3